MEGRVPLAIAIVTGALAIAIVAIDLQFSLEAELQGERDGQWVTLSEDGRYAEPTPFGYECASPQLRVQVSNNRLLPADVPVRISYWDPEGGNRLLLDETWNMGRGEVRTHAFTVPADAFTSEVSGTPQKVSVTVEVRVDDIYLGHCVQEAA